MGTEKTAPPVRETPSTAKNNSQGQAGPAKDDGVLESIGKAIADPIESAAESEEPRQDGRPPQSP